MKRFLSLLPLVIVLGPSCERHDFEGPDGTKQLHEKHGAHHGDDAHGHEEKAAH